MNYEQEIGTIIEEYKNNKPIGLKLIMSYDKPGFSDRLYNEVDDTIFNYATNTNKNLLEDDKIKILIAMVLVALEEYDSSFWDHVKDKCKKSFSDAKYSNKSIALIKVILKESPVYDPNLRFISVPLKQAAVPQYWLKRYFEFCQDIYEHNLLFRYSDDLFVRNKFLNIFGQLKTKKILSNDDSETHIQITNKKEHSEKIYKLSASTKQLINSSDSLDSLLDISCICTKAINNKDDSPDNLPSFFKQPFLEWKKENEKTLNDKREQIERDGKIITSPRFVIEVDQNNTPFVILETDTVSIPNKKDYPGEELFIIVKSNGLTIADKQIEYYDSDIFGEVSVNSERFIVDNPFNDISYMIAHKNRLGEVDDVLYPTNGKPRQMIIQNDVFFYDYKKRKIVHENSNYGYGDLYAICKNNQTLYSSFCVKWEPYYIYFLSVSPSTYFKIDGRNICFSKTNIIGLNGNKNDRASFETENNIYPVYSIIDELVVETDCNDELFFICDGKIKDCIKEVKKINEVTYRTIFKLSFLENGFHSILVVTHKKELFPKTSFVLDCNLTVCCSDDNVLTVTSEGYHFQKAFFDGESEIKENVSYGDTSGTLHVKTFKFGFSYNNFDWDCVSSYASFEQIQNSEHLFITGIVDDKALVVLNSLSTDQKCNDMIVGTKTMDGNYSFDLSLLAKYKNDYGDVTLVFDGSKSDSKKLFIKFYSDVRVVISYDENTEKNYMVPSFNSMHPIFVKFINESLNECVKVGPLESMNKVEIDGLKPFVDYSVVALEDVGYNHFQSHFIKKYSYSSLKKINGLSFKVDKIYYVESKSESVDCEGVYSESDLEERIEVEFVKGSNFYIGILKHITDSGPERLCYVMLDFIGDFINNKISASIENTQPIKNNYGTNAQLRFNKEKKTIVANYHPYEEKCMREINVIEITKI